MPPENTAEKLELATQSMNSGDLDRAETLLAELLQADPELAAALRLSGVVACRKGKYQAAIDLMGRALASNPQDDLAFVTRGLAYRALGDLPAAEESLRQALALSPGRYDAQFNLALTLWAAGDHSQAADYFRSALAQGIESFAANFYLGQVYLETDDPDSAEQYLRRALAVNPKSGKSRFFLGKIQLARGRIPEALEEFDAGAELDPQDFDHRLFAAKAAFELGREASAWGYLEAVPRHAEGDVRWDRGRAQSLENWCAQNDCALIQIGKTQSHRVRPATILPADRKAMDAMAAMESTDFTTPEISVARLAQCRVLPLDHMLVTTGNDENRVVFLYGVMSRPMHRSYTSPHIVHGSDDGRLLLEYPGREVKIDIPCAYLGVAEGYCNWLSECVTRLWSYHQRPDWAALPLAVHADASRHQLDLLELLGYGESRRVKIAADCVSRFPALTVATLSGAWNCVAPFAIEHLRRGLAKTVSVSSSTPQRIFLSREGLGSRRLGNIGELLPMLEKHGFVPIGVESIVTRDLLQMIRSADAIIGMEGAAMANAFFAPVHAKIAMVTANAGQAIRYSAASCAIGQEFTYLQGEADFTTNPLLADCDVRLDARVLEDYLSKI